MPKNPTNTKYTDFPIRLAQEREQFLLPCAVYRHTTLRQKSQAVLAIRKGSGSTSELVTTVQFLVLDLGHEEGRLAKRNASTLRQERGTYKLAGGA